MSDEIAIELGEGFADDEVAVMVDGSEVWRGSAVTTNYSVGLANVVRIPAPPHEAVVEVQVRGKSSDTTKVDATAAAGEVRLRARMDPAGTVALAPADEGPIY